MTINACWHEICTDNIFVTFLKKISTQTINASWHEKRIVWYCASSVPALGGGGDPILRKVLLCCCTCVLVYYIDVKGSFPSPKVGIYLSFTALPVYVLHFGYGPGLTSRYSGGGGILILICS